MVASPWKETTTRPRAWATPTKPKVCVVGAWRYWGGSGQLVSAVGRSFMAVLSHITAQLIALGRERRRCLTARRHSESRRPSAMRQPQESSKQAPCL